MRLFAGLRPSGEFRRALAELQERLRSAGITGKYRDPSGLHMTLAFIGEWPEDVTGILPAVTRPFSVTLSHPGVFPKANVLWAGVEPCEALDRLAGEVRRSLAGNGIPFDPKAFNPHITLARKPAVPAEVNLAEFMVPAVSMTVDEVCLFRSERGISGMEYAVIGSTGKNAAELG